MMRVLILDTVHTAIHQKLDEAGFECEVWQEEKDPAQVAKALANYEGLVLRSGISVTKSLLEANPQLRFIGRIGAGLEHIDVDFATKQGVVVLSSPEGNRQAVAEHALGSLLTLFNRIHIADAEVRTGVWARKQNEGIELQGKTVGIVGYGNTGAAFARVLSGFDTRILAFDKYKSGFGTETVAECSMEDLHREADVVSLHIPYNEETHYLVNQTWLGRFIRPFYLINTSRGGIVKTEDLIAAIDSGQLLGACLDVLEFETEQLKMPPIHELPDSAQRLFQLPNVIFTPHIAGLTHESYRKLSESLAEKIIERFKPA